MKTILMVLGIVLLIVEVLIVLLGALIAAHSWDELVPELTVGKAVIVLIASLIVTRK